MLSGWLGLGVGIDRDIFVECQGYTRPAFVSAAVGGDAIHQTLRPIVGVTGDGLDDWITVGGIFDAEIGGHCLCHWSWRPTRVALPGTWPQIDVIVLFSYPVRLAINQSSVTGETAGLEIGRGSSIGAMNGNVMITGCRLVVVGGQLVARASAPAKRPVTV